MSTTTLDALNAAALEAARGPVRTSRPSKPARRILATFPASNPRGSWPAEEFANDRRREGIPADVVMDLDTDAFLVIVEGVAS